MQFKIMLFFQQGVERVVEIEAIGASDAGPPRCERAGFDTKRLLWAQRLQRLELEGRQLRVEVGLVRCRQEDLDCLGRRRGGVYS